MKRILCYGDSNTWGADPLGGPRFGAEVRYTGVLARSLGAGFTVIEEGLGGRTTVLDDPFEPWRNGRTYLRPCLLSHNPLDLVTLMLGTNDLKLRHGVTPQDSGIGIEALVGDIRWLLADHPPRILVIAPVPPGAPIRRHARLGPMFGEDSPERGRAMTPVYEATARALGCDFFDAGQYAALEHGDGLHLNAADHQAVGQALAEKVRAILA